MDFAATLKTPDGAREVLIEIQKSRRASNIARFRQYIGKQYTRTSQSLPMVAIYILGFNLGELTESVIHIRREAVGKIQGHRYPPTHPYIDKLTHDAYLVQVQRLASPYRNYLEEMLSVFDQHHIMNDKHYLLDISEQSLPPIALRAARRLQQIAQDQNIQERLEMEAIA
ncbi:MAG: hypothetical protein OHK0039_07740 [Bacteroidia bacterium]